MWKKSLTFGSNSLKMAVSFCVVLFGSNSKNVSIVLYEL